MDHRETPGFGKGMFHGHHDPGCKGAIAGVIHITAQDFHRGVMFFGIEIARNANQRVRFTLKNLVHLATHFQCLSCAFDLGQIIPLCPGRNAVPDKGILFFPGHWTRQWGTQMQVKTMQNPAAIKGDASILRGPIPVEGDVFSPVLAFDKAMGWFCHQIMPELMVLDHGVARHNGQIMDIGKPGSGPVAGGTDMKIRKPRSL